VAKPTIAVVIPTYNAGRFVSEAVESVRTQTTSQWECVIVDDGSTDETPDRLVGYRDSRIRWIRQENSGIHAARARGVALTGAAKIVFLDADDRLYPDTLARYVSFLDQDAAVGVVYGERTLIDSNGDSFGLEWGAILNKHPQGAVLQSILRRPFLSTLSQACLRRAAVPPLEWLGDRGPMADWLLLAGAALNTKFAYIGRAPLVKYRVRPSSLMRSIASDPQAAADIREFQEVLDRLFSFPGMEHCIGATELAELRQAAEASCFAIKGQEYLRQGERRAARRHFGAALRSGSRDPRDFICWAATFVPALVRWSGPLFGAIHPPGDARDRTSVHRAPFNDSR
jgi:hypothetical protein